MAERVLGNVISSGINVLVLAVIIDIGSTLFSQFTAGFGGATPTIDDAMAIVLGALSLLGLGIFGPGIARGLVSGGPQLRAGAAVGTGLAVGGASAAGAASSAYTLAAMGESGASGVAAGLGGVARADGAAAVSPLKRAVSRAADSLKSSHAAGIKGGFETTGGTSTMGTIGGAAAPAPASSPSTGGPPAWAQRVRGQAISHGVRAAAHAARSGDSHGGGASISLSESNRS
jgi:type IV secretion system protein TrbL